MEDFSLSNELRRAVDINATYDPSSLSLDEIVDLLAVSPIAITSGEVFNNIRFIIKNILSLNDSGRLVDVLVSAFDGIVTESSGEDIDKDTIIALQMFGLAILQLLYTMDASVDKANAKSKKATSSVNVRVLMSTGEWTHQIERILDIACKIFRSRIARWWTTSSEHDNFVG